MSSDPSSRKGYRRIASSSVRVRLHIRHHKPQASGGQLRSSARCASYPMRDERLEVSVTFDARHGYIGSAPQLRTPVTALSLGGLRRRIEVLLLPDDVDVVLERLQTAAAEDRRSVRRRLRAPRIPRCWSWSCRLPPAIGRRRAWPLRSSASPRPCWSKRPRRRSAYCPRTNSCGCSDDAFEIGTMVPMVAKCNTCVTFEIGTLVPN